MVYKCCFVPTCGNTSRNSPGKVFVHIRDSLKEKWFKSVGKTDIKRNAFCCEDHLNLRNDLENYYNWKLMRAAPKLKVTANICVENINENGLLPRKNIRLNKQLRLKKEKKTQIKKNIEPKESPSTSESESTTQVLYVNNVDKTTQTQVIQNEDKFTMTPQNFDKKKSIINVYKIQNKVLSEHKLKLIQKYSKFYIGVPKNIYWILNFIQKTYLIDELFLIITLFKIKQNDSMLRIAKEFKIPEHVIRKEFSRSISVLASFFQHIIYFPDRDEVKKNLPVTFRKKYSNVHCIIDCLEIQIKKPSNPITQAQTWSKYKHCNTLKYLISCTPDGFINFISEGFGGGISDEAIVQQSGFIDCLPKKAVVLSDQRFEGIEVTSKSKEAKLLSSNTGAQLSNPLADQYKVIKGVIKKVREFKFLKLHSNLENSYINLVDSAVITACGLTNLEQSTVGMGET